MTYEDIEPQIEKSLRYYTSHFRIPEISKQDIAQEVRIWFSNNLGKYDSSRGGVIGWVNSSVKFLCLNHVSQRVPKFHKKCQRCIERGDDYCYEHGSKFRCPSYLKAIAKWCISMGAETRPEIEGEDEFFGISGNVLNWDNFNYEEFIRVLLGRLTKRQKEIFHLLYDESLSASEISERLQYKTESTKGNWTTRWHLKNIQVIAKEILEEKDWLTYV